MATEKWITGSGQGLTWGNAFSTATLNSIASGNAIISDLQIDNSTALDVFADVSINLATGVTFVAPNYIGVYLYPLNADGSTYGDGRFGSSVAGPPASSYWVGNIVIPAAASPAEGTLRGVIIPPGKFKFLIYNQGGAALASSGNTCQYRTYNRALA